MLWQQQSLETEMLFSAFFLSRRWWPGDALTDITICKRHHGSTRQTESVSHTADNSTNNSSSNINKILVLGKEKTVFKDPKDRQVKQYYPKKKAVTLSIGSGQKEILMAQKNPGEGGTSL